MAFIQESAQWLFSNGKDREAIEILQCAARENGVEITPGTLNDLLKANNNSTPDVKKVSILDLFRNSYLRKKFIILFFNCSTYYGLSLNATNLGSDDHLNFLISGIVEIPAYYFLIFTLNRWGRKKILYGSMIISGMSLITSILFPLGISHHCHFFISIYFFTAEQVLTVVRNVGMGACSTFAKLGGAFAPFIIYLSEFWEPLPLIVFGVCVLTGGLLSLLSPETLDKKLPDTIQDVEISRLQDENSKVKKRKNRPKLEPLDVLQLNNRETAR